MIRLFRELVEIISPGHIETEQAVVMLVGRCKSNCFWLRKKDKIRTLESE